MPHSHKVSVLFSSFKRDQVLDPSKIKFVAEYDCIRTLSVRLVGTDRDGSYVNELADKILFEDRGKKVTLTIKNASFSDGTPITAKDVYYSIKRLILNGSPHSDPKSFIKGADKLKNLDDPIEGIQVVDDRTLLFKLNFPIKELLYYFQLADYAILHSSQYRKDILKTEDWTRAVSGPYRLVWNDKDRYYFARNPGTLLEDSRMPDRVDALTEKELNLPEALKHNQLDFGHLTFKGYFDLRDQLKQFPEVKAFGFKENYIAHIDLNVDSPVFKKSSTRQWVRKRLLEKLAVPSGYSDSVKKASQFFIPNSRGYLNEQEIKRISDDSLKVDIDVVPKELKNGFVVRSVPGMINYMPPDTAETLSAALGIPVTIKLDVEYDKFNEFRERRLFDASMMATAMDYKVLGEALNLQYISSPPPLKDPSGHIRALLKTYHSETDPEKETALIKQILTQMLIDSENIPLFYVLSPYFYRVDKLDVSEVNILESLQIWRLRVKQ